MCDVVDSSLDILQVNFKFFIHKSVCVCVCVRVCVSEVPTTTPAVITTGINTNTNAPCQKLAYRNQRRY